VLLINVYWYLAYPSCQQSLLIFGVPNIRAYRNSPM